LESFIISSNLTCCRYDIAEQLLFKQQSLTMLSSDSIDTCYMESFIVSSNLTCCRRDITKALLFWH